MSYTLQSKAFCVVTTNDSENCLLIQFPLLSLKGLVRNEYLHCHRYQVRLLPVPCVQSVSAVGCI